MTSKPDPDHAALTRFDVRFQDGPHWELREQVNLVDHGTRPDFYATRVDATGTAPVAIYLDGWEHHGADPDQVDLDSGRRASVRGGGTTVWTLTWQDVKAALTAASQGATVPAILPLPNPVRHNAVQGAKRANGGDHPTFDAVHRGAFDQLMLFLAHPGATAWRHLAMTTALAAGSSGTTLQVGDQATAVDQAARNVPIELAGHETGIAALTWATQNGQLAVTVLERDGSPLPTAVSSHDTATDPDKGRWADWLHMANLLQHLGDHAVITTTRTYTPAGTTVTIATPAAATLHGGEDLLAEVFDPAALPLARAAIDAGWTQLSVGYPSGDADDTPIEIVWPNSSVGILATGGTRPTTLTDWDLRTPDRWTEAELLAALAGGTP